MTSRIYERFIDGHKKQGVWIARMIVRKAPVPMVEKNRFARMERMLDRLLAREHRLIHGLKPSEYKARQL